MNNTAAYTITAGYSAINVVHIVDRVDAMHAIKPTWITKTNLGKASVERSIV